MQLPASKGDGSIPDLAVIRGTFAAALREKGYRPSTIGVYLRVLCRAASLRAGQGGSLAQLRREDVPGLLRRLLRRRHDRHYYQTCGSPLYAWLKFHGRFAKPVPLLPWQSWLDDYAQFLNGVRGLAPITSTGYVSCARAFMVWQFAKKPAQWSRVLAPDLWRYGEQCAGAKHHKRAPVRASTQRGASPRQAERSPACNRRLLRRGDTGWGAAGSEQPVRNKVIDT